MGSPPEARVRDVRRLLDDLVAWARARDDVHAVVLVGSWARGEATAASDVDVVVLSTRWGELAADPSWFVGLRPGSELVRAAAWGPLLERRFRTPSGLVVELGLAAPGWAGTPLDPGTHRVLRDGHRILHDPHGTMAQLSGGVSGGMTPSA